MTQGAEAKPRTITITVNNKPLAVEERKITGLEIKQAAIAQGVNIQLDFQLTLIMPRGERIVGDVEEIVVTKAHKFVATAADDNSEF